MWRVHVLLAALSAIAGCGRSDGDEVNVGHIPTAQEQRAVATQGGIVQYYDRFASVVRFDSRILVAVRSPSYKETWADVPASDIGTAETNRRFIDQAGHGTVDNKKAGPVLVLLDTFEPLGSSVYVTGYMEGSWYIYDAKGHTTNEKREFHSRFKSTWEKDADGKYRLLTTSFAAESKLSQEDMAKLKKDHAAILARYPS